MQVLKADSLVLPGGKLEQGPSYVSINEGMIVGVSKSLPAGLSSEEEVKHVPLITPGFVDIHTHGVGGADDVSETWTNPGFSQGIFPRQGTTSFLASVVFPRDTPDKTAAILSGLGARVGLTGFGAVLEGIHAEGPIVNDLGAMPTSNAAMPLDEFERLLDSAPGLRVMTISPHLESRDNYSKIKALVSRGIVPAMGHDLVATETEILGAMSASPDRQLHITHLFNVCSFHHRQPGIGNFGMCQELPRLPQYAGLTPPTLELIGDMTHVHPMMVATVLRARSFRDVCFVTDAVLEPRPGARASYSGRQLEVAQDGRTVSLLGEGILAGSCCSQLDTLRSLVGVLGVPLAEAVAMLSESPARVAGLGHVGGVAAGKRADLLLLTDELALIETLVAGETVFRADTA